MSSEKLADFIWINGQFVPWDQSNIHVITHSLHYSGAVYEGLRAYNGVIFKLEEHTERLLRSAKMMGLKIDYTVGEINKITYEVLKENNLKDAYIRPLIWRGSESLGLNAPNLSINFLIVAINSKREFTNNVRIILSPWLKPAPNAFPPQAKSSAHYGMAIVSQNFAREKGYDDCLVLDHTGFIAECNVANIFFGRGNKLITPIADNFLNGITRQTMIGLANNLGFDVKEKLITLDEINSYNYCFMTGTAKEVSGISEINLNEKGICLFGDPEGKIGMLQNEFAQVVGK